MNGHGQVTPNPDGSKARCGGPSVCPLCTVEFAEKHHARTQALSAIPNLSKPGIAPLTEYDVRRIVAEMVTGRAERRIEKLRYALRSIADGLEDDDNAIANAIEMAACTLANDDKLARGEA